MKLSVIDQLIEIYFYVDEFLKKHPVMAQWRLSNNSEPNFTDAEVLSIAMMQGYFGCANLKKTYLLVVANADGAFPHLCGYKQWMARLHKLTPLVGGLVIESSRENRESDDFYLMDSKPIPVCHPLRHGRVRSLREDGAYFGKTKKGWFFGFKLHVIVNRHGRVLGAIFTPANTNDRDPAIALGWSVDGGLCLGDLGYRGEEFRDLMMEQTDLLLITPADGKDQRHYRALISSLRERVETTFSQLWSLFVDRVFSRSWNGLWNTIKLKMLHFNLCEAGVIPA